ncbi:hypothetical protein CSUB01_08761 [Colletotrichum sublineola]|uniref:Uncharacterized protein n=1 Tax=Colletotrichum sublineola TaxID=1173701 RepID=A0A066XX46_COLSU|nr:hypothetical protein CSUB01_08761 [Colletotrichum sublineola]
MWASDWTKAAPRLRSDEGTRYQLQHPGKLPAAPAQISISGKLAGDTCTGRSLGPASRPKWKQLTLHASQMTVVPMRDRGDKAPTRWNRID